MNPRLSRWLVPGIPFLVSLGLSASTVGKGVFWQDSGFYLVAVKDLDILYPPGFVLYLLLCKAWTLLFFFVDFTLAVHLFSSFCAALAAGTLAVAARELLRARGPLFRVLEAEPGSLADWVGAATGCIVASGYTFWFTGIYAKGYSLYYFILSQLLWRMIRAHETGSRRDLTWVAALIGLCWAAHPSAALLGIVFIAYVATQRRLAGFWGIAWRTGLCALCAIGPTLLLPLMARKRSLQAMGDPTDPHDFLGYLLGTVYTSRPGVFGWVESRVASFGQYLWEEMLGIGVLLVAVGLVVLVRANRRLLLGVLLWLIPYATVTILFKVEGQHDCWFVAAWLPLYPALAVGLHALAKRSAPYSRQVLVGLSACSVAWATLLNLPILQQRGYDLPDHYGRLILGNLDPNAVLIISGDDPVAICTYLQQVQKVRPDVAIVNAAFLRGHNRSSGDWYVDRLLQTYPFLVRPDLSKMLLEFGPQMDLKVTVAAFLNANLDLDRPLFTTIAPASRATRSDLALVPAGVLWKVVRKGQEKTDPRYWEFPITAQEVRARYRRERGQSIEYTVDDMIVKPEGYERRLYELLLGARAILANAHLRQGNFAQSARIYAKILEVDPEKAKDPKILYGMAHAFNGMGEVSRAEPLFTEVLKRTADPKMVAGSFLVLGQIYFRRGDKEGARRVWKLALTVDDVDLPLREEIERELREK